MRKFLATFLSICLMAIVVPWQAKAEVTADTFLNEHGVPADVIEQMTDLQKEYLCEMLPDNAKFESYSSQEYMMADDDSLVATCGQISASDLTMSVVAFSNGNGTYEIYPSFVMRNPSKNVSNDVFGISLYPGWEMTPGVTPNCRLWNKNSNNQLAAYGDYGPKVIAASGVAFQFGKNLVSSAGFEGHAAFTATQKASNATRAVAMNYAHDKSSLFSVSFSISIGVGQVSITPNRANDVDTMAGVFPF